MISRMNYQTTKGAKNHPALCGRVEVPEGEREGTQRYQLRLETAPDRFFLVDFLLLALSYEKLEEAGKGKEE